LRFGEVVIINKSMKKIRILVIIAILAASVVFGLQFFLGSGGVKSRAGAESVKVFFEKNQIDAMPEGAVEVNVFLTTSATAKISAVKANFIYPADLLTYYPTPEGQSESHCYNPKLTKEISVNNRVNPVNKSLGYLSISRTAMKKDKDLPSGLFCLGTFVFKPKKAGEGKLSFNENLSEWEIVGPQNAYTPSFDKSKSSITIKIGQAGQMCNTSCLTDSDCGGAGLVCYKEGWPDTCPHLPPETLGKLKKGQTLPSEDINKLAQICPLAKDQLKLKLNGMPTVLKGVCRNSQCPTTSVANCQCSPVTCKLRPLCLDDLKNPCKMPEPVEGWCPKPTIVKCTPRLKCMDMTPPCNPIVIPGTVFCPKPTSTPKPTPTPTLFSCQKILGDADCKDGINLVDFEIWRKEFTKELATKTADFNKDTKISLADFEIWRSSYYK